ncbi:MAG: hypothetical protein ACLUD2_05620 [Clostridium sp.]
MEPNTRKHSETDSVKAMMPVSVMDSGKDGTMTAGQADSGGPGRPDGGCGCS